jgi:hypothetical protein
LYTEYEPPCAPIAFRPKRESPDREARTGPLFDGVDAPHTSGTGLTPLELGYVVSWRGD